LVAQRADREVLLARTLGESGRPIEVLLEKLTITSAEATRAFRDLAQRIAGLDHPSIPRILEVGQFAGRSFITEELVEGVDLRELMAALKAEPRTKVISFALGIGQTILGALTHAHTRRADTGRTKAVVHGSLSPESVVISFRGEVKLPEFGLKGSAGIRGATSGAYRAPEQLRGQGFDGRADLFALAAMLYEILFARHPFDGGEGAQVESAILSKPPSKPTRNDVPDAIVQVVLRALSSRPEDRPASAQEMQSELGRALDLQLKPASREELSQYVSARFAERIRTLETARKIGDDAMLIDALAIGGTTIAEASQQGGPAASTPTERGTDSHTSSMGGTHGKGAMQIRLEGIFDEAFDTAKVLAQIKDARAVIFDLDGVRRITSYGVREWLQMLQSVRADYYCFVKVRPPLMAQFNMVSSFGGSGELVSVYSPYVCPQCGEALEVLVDLRVDRSVLTATEPTTIACPKCKAQAQFDDIAESYFAYAAEAPAPSPPSAVQEILDGSSAGRKEGLRVQKEVEDTVTAFWISGALDKNIRFKRIADGIEGVVVAELSRVKGCTEEGIAELSAFLGAAEVDVHLARVPLELAVSLHLAGIEYGHGRAFSALLPFQCPVCPWKGEIEVLAPFDWLDDRRQGSTQLCHECFQAAIEHTVDRAGIAALRAIPPGDVPDEAREYLADHLTAPSRTRSPSTAGDDEPATGLHLLGKYQLVRRLGQGGMAEVFLAKHIGTRGFEKRVAVKRIMPHLAQRESFVDMFFREARLAARISHSNVVQIFDLGKIGEHYYIAMEYVRGWDLNTVLGLAKRMDINVPIEVACRIVADICAALHAAHTTVDDRGVVVPIIHRDVSPHNVLISTEGVVKLTDFGIAKASDSVTLTSTGEVRGKISYMAPERVRSSKEVVDERSDIFSAGVVLFESLTLVPLFRREDKYRTMQAIVHAPVPRMSKLRSAISTDLEDIVDRALARFADKRTPSAQQLRVELEEFMAKNQLDGSAPHLSSWLRALLTKGVQLGQISTDVSFTPAAGLTEEILPKVSGRTISKP
jgi:serine/threonine protein kinase